MSVNDISGLPILEVFSDDRIVAGTFNTNTLVVTGSRIGIGKSAPTTLLDISGSGVTLTGSMFVSGNIRFLNTYGITISDTAGTAESVLSVSTANNVALTAPTLAGSIIYTTRNTSAAHQFLIGTSGTAEKMRINSTGMGIGKTTPSTILDVSGSMLLTGSLNVQGSITASVFGTSSVATTASYVLPAGLPTGTVSSSAQINTGSFSGSITTASFATTASYALSATVTLPAGVVSSSTQFTSLTAPFTGSFTGSFKGDGTGLTGVTATAAPPAGTVSSSAQVTASIIGATIAPSIVSASFITASNLQLVGLTPTTNANSVLVIDTTTNNIFYTSSVGGGSGATFPYVGDAVITGSLILSGSAGTELTVVGDSVVSGTLEVTSKILYSNFYSTTASLPSATQYHGMFTHVHSENAAYYSHGSNGWVKLWDQFNFPNAAISGSLLGRNIGHTLAQSRGYDLP
jgi:hypothetical protein